MNIGLKLLVFWDSQSANMFSSNHLAPIDEISSKYPEQKSKLMENNKISVINKNNIYHYLLFINCNLGIKLNKKQNKIHFNGNHSSIL